MTVVYSAVFGDIDQSKRPVVDGRFVMFTDNPHRVPGWDMRVLASPKDPRLAARRFKMQPHKMFPDEEVTIWTDGSVRLKIPQEQIVEEWLDGSDIGVFEHPARFCAYDEGKRCVQFNIGEKTGIQQQLLCYHRAGFPADIGLAETRVVVRRNTPAVREFNEAWWHEIQTQTTRDQLSFPYVAWKLGMKYRAIPMLVAWAHPSFEFNPHKGVKWVRLEGGDGG